jgi:hypothetical protein
MATCSGKLSWTVRAGRRKRPSRPGPVTRRRLQQRRRRSRFRAARMANTHFPSAASDDRQGPDQFNAHSRRLAVSFNAFYPDCSVLQRANDRDAVRSPDKTLCILVTTIQRYVAPFASPGLHSIGLMPRNFRPFQLKTISSQPRLKIGEQFLVFPPRSVHALKVISHGGAT